MEIESKDVSKGFKLLIFLRTISLEKVAVV